MPFIVNTDISSKALQSLEKFDEVILFKTIGITYSAISNHPDIFFTPIGKSTMIYAPNTPPAYIDKLINSNVIMISGEKKVTLTYPGTACYNACVTSSHIIHNTKITDREIVNQLPAHTQLHVAQGYTRCNLIAFSEKHFMTSDMGIYNTLLKHNFNVLFVSPENIILKGFKNGFLGGCCGIMNNFFFINGALKHLPGLKYIDKFMSNLPFNIIELSSGKPEDIGAILHI